MHLRLGKTQLSGSKTRSHARIPSHLNVEFFHGITMTQIFFHPETNESKTYKAFKFLVFVLFAKNRHEKLNWDSQATNLHLERSLEV